VRTRLALELLSSCMQVLTTAHSPRLKLLTRAARALCPRAHAAAVHPSCLGRARSREQAAAEALDEQLRHIHMMENQLRIVNHWVEDWVNDCSLMTTDDH